MSRVLGSSRWRRLAVVLVVQTVLLGFAVWGQLSARLTGQEIVLKVAPYDPVDPFRGAYLQLSYPDLPALDLGVGEDRRGTAYVPLRQAGDHWVGGPLAADPPANGPYLTCDDTSWRLRCGIEDWFLSQGNAESADEQLRNGGRATIRVDRFGHAALVGLAFGP